MAHAYGYCLKRAPVPTWWLLYNEVKNYGVLPVFGREVLHRYEMHAMTLTANVITSFKAREKSGDWVRWEASNPEHAELLEQAGNQYKVFEAEW